jgi:hypothetical protein
MLINRSPFIKFKIKEIEYSFSVRSLSSVVKDDSSIWIYIDEKSPYTFTDQSLSKKDREDLYKKFLDYFNPTNFGDFGDC